MSHPRNPKRPAISTSSAVSGVPGPPGPEGPEGPEGREGQQGPPGPGITDVRLVSAVFSQPDVLKLSRDLQCGSGEIALGGGAQVEGLNDAILTESRPLAGPDGVAVGWRASGRQSAPFLMTLRIGVICARVVPPND